MSVARRKDTKQVVTLCPDRSRVFLAAEPAVVSEEPVEETDAKGKPTTTMKPVTKRAADIAIVIQVAEGDAPVREWLSSTKRLTDKDRKALARIFKALTESAVSTEYEPAQ